ncbi:MAG: OmpA family protein [Deltaproteobacteria bacterium]|nr:OmpA family protein [Deltaproteobacteria bacterium]
MLTLLISAALAQDAVTLDAVRRVQDGLGAASLTVHAHATGQIDASLSCGGKTWSLHQAIQPGQDYTLVLDGLPRGAHHCRGTLTLRGDDGAEGSMPLSLGIDVLPPLTLEVRREELDLKGQSLTVRADRPLSLVRVQALGEGGAELGSGELSVFGEREAELGWGPASSQEILKLVVHAEDADHLGGKLELSPWSYAIPHEDVVFASGSAAVDVGEVPKLERAWADLQQVLDRYGAVVEVRLYVAGYTDTVGAAEGNLGLSQRRAEAIASWFKSRGFDGQIAYQGFGEAVLATPTADEVDEAANRRAIYLLAAEEPQRGPELPASEWTPLK